MDNLPRMRGDVDKPELFVCHFSMVGEERDRSNFSSSSPMRGIASMLRVISAKRMVHESKRTWDYFLRAFREYLTEGPLNGESTRLPDPFKGMNSIGDYFVGV